MVKLDKSKSVQVKKAAKILKSGGVVIYPTDTVYGIGCRFDNQESIDRIYRIKGRDQTQPFPILVSKIDQVQKIANVNKLATLLIAKYWPGALTILVTGKDNRKYGFRMPDSDLARFLIDKVDVPIIGTSANFHGQKPATSFGELDPKIVKLADFVIKGKCLQKKESTVVDTTISPPQILRQGAISPDLKT